MFRRLDSLTHLDPVSAGVKEHLSTNRQLPELSILLNMAIRAITILALMSPFYARPVSYMRLEEEPQ